jgi:hypothetical protein
MQDGLEMLARIVVLRSGLYVLPVALGGHALLLAFVVVFRAVRGFFRDAAAVFLALGAGSTADGNSSLGCFGVL